MLSDTVIRSLHHHMGHMQIDNTAARNSSIASPKAWLMDDGIGRFTHSMPCPCHAVR